MFKGQLDVSVVCEIRIYHINLLLLFKNTFLFRLEDFPNEPILWKEIENFTLILCMDIACLSEEQAFFREMFSALPLCKQINI